MQITPLGDSALVVRVVDDFSRDPDGSLDAVLRVLGTLEGAALPGVIALAPAYSTVAVFYDAALSPFDLMKTRIEKALEVPNTGLRKERAARTVEIPVCYDAEFGLDLEQVSAHVKLPVEDLIERHASASYRVACVGFIAGFPFLSGLPSELAIPRRVSPRKEVPAGSVAIGGVQTGVYPRKSPGGWNIIGRTPVCLFDISRDPPAIFHAGDRVRFRKISREEFNTFGA